MKPSLAYIGACTGAKLEDLRMAARYQHLSPAFLQEAVGKLDAVFGSLKEANLVENLE